jgi:hypothetical protein
VLRFIPLAVAAFFLLCTVASAQVRIVQTTEVQQSAPVASVASPKQEPQEVKRSDFSKEVVKAAVAAQRKGEISRLELVRLRVAMISPAFRAKVEDLAVVQIAASGEEGGFSVDEDGNIIRETIDWDGLAAFLEKLIPLILMLIKAFGV